MTTAVRWSPLYRAFRDTHRSPTNVVAHAVTTPLGLFGFASLLALVAPWLAIAAGAGNAASLWGRISERLRPTTTIVVAAIVGAAIELEIGALASLFAMAAGYGFQDLAHRWTGERTFQSTYEREPGATASLVRHTWMLLPLVLAALAEYTGVVQRFLPRVRVVRTRLEGRERLDDVERVRHWVAHERPCRDRTTHWWFHEPPAEVRDALARIAHSPEILDAFRAAHPGCDVEVVGEMNEIYVSGPDQERSSDAVFYTPHVDGPYAVWPGAAVYRALLGVTPNRRIETVFVHPQDGGEPLAATVSRGDLLAFDFNRELHFIRSRPDVAEEEPRCVLKLHYVVHPERWAWWGRILARLTGAYDRRARALFLSTLRPDSGWARAKAWAVLATTHTFDRITRHAGWNNLAWVALLALLSAATGSWLPLLLGASFVHYLLYLGVFEFREAISFGQFKRDAMFFKTVSYGMLAALYLSFGVFDPVSLALIVIGFGILSFLLVLLHRNPEPAE